MLFGTCLVMPGELIWRVKNWCWSVMKIEETLMMKKMKNDEMKMKKMSVDPVQYGYGWG